MAQEYNEILPSGSTNILQDNIDSRKNDEALRSGFSGSAFPTSPVPVAGQRCYREDLKKEYIFNGENWVEVASSGAIAQEVTLARGTHTELKDRLDVSMNPDGTLKTPATANVDEFKVSGFEPTYVSTNSFSVPGDVRAIFTENRRLKITQGAETVYPAVVSASYDDVADKTTIVIDNITITTEITAVDFSMVQSGLPSNLNAATLNGKSDTAFQEVAEKNQPGGYVGLNSRGALNSKISSTFISDFNTATIGGLYYTGTATLNKPSSSAMTALVIDRPGSAYLTQIAFTGNEDVYIRFSTNSSNTEWTDWKRIDEATDVYTMGNILGTVSQVGGVPTGAIIERGSNANGEYIRFADGTQICASDSVSVAVNNTKYADVLCTFPASFVDTDYAIAAIPIATVVGYVFSIGRIQTKTSSSVKITGYDASSTARTGTLSVSYVCIGRWF